MEGVQPKKLGNLLYLLQCTLPEASRGIYGLSLKEKEKEKEKIVWRCVFLPFWQGRFLFGG